jgi:ankyrin repeat protein
MSVRTVAALVAMIVLACPRLMLAEAEAPTTAPADRRALSVVLLNVLEYSSQGVNSPVTVLLERGADPNVRARKGGHTPLHVLIGSAAGAAKRPAQARDFLQAAGLLLRHGADPSLRDGEGKSSLDLAGKLDESAFRTDLLGLLQKPAASGAKVAPPLDAKAARLALNDCAWNVIQYPPDDAAILIECLLKVGADPRSSEGVGDVLLHGLAFNCGNTWTVSNNDWRRAAVALVKAGADVNGRAANDGGTPLDDAVHTAAMNAEYGYSNTAAFGMVQFLVEHGADPAIRDKGGKTASDHAAEIKDAGVKQRLLDLLGKKRG